MVTPTATQSLLPLSRLRPDYFHGPAVHKKLTTASRKLAELKGLTASFPNPGILVNALALQEAKDSSAIEGIHTTYDELFRTVADDSAVSPAANEVRNCMLAFGTGLDLTRRTGLLTENHIIAIQKTLDAKAPGYRKIFGTAVRDGAGRVVHMPPQSHDEIVSLMTDLERFINADSVFDADPLIKMAIMHHQFESIHPFYDGNGRTGRIMNTLYIMNKGLLDIPVLNMSSYIVKNRREYYRLLQSIRGYDDSPAAWQEWVIFMVSAVEAAADHAMRTIGDVRNAMHDCKHRIRSEFKFYRRELINNLFAHPYNRIEFVENDVGVSRLTATKYLEALTTAGFLRKIRVGRSNYYINVALNEILTQGHRD